MLSFNNIQIIDDPPGARSRFLNLSGKALGERLLIVSGTALAAGKVEFPGDSPVASAIPLKKTVPIRMKKRYLVVCQE